MRDEVSAVLSKKTMPLLERSGCVTRRTSHWRLGELGKCYPVNGALRYLHRNAEKSLQYLAFLLFPRHSCLRERIDAFFLSIL